MTSITFDSALHHDAARSHGKGVLAALRGMMSGLAGRRQLGLHHRATLDLDNHLRADIGLPEVMDVPRIRASVLVGW
ncbi:hypothetical protein [Muricoccus radiodurans]|uniref:hypothetical protein n=1 Tax=Muricoccus radiodurans TaxID=2231721 RepID=UPI003CF722DE